MPPSPLSSAPASTSRAATKSASLRTPRSPSTTEPSPRFAGSTSTPAPPSTAPARSTPPSTTTARSPLRAPINLDSTSAPTTISPPTRHSTSSSTATEQPSFLVTGDATLAGTLIVTTGKGFKPSPGKSYTVLTANRITGTFANPDNEVVATDGTRFTIRYSDSAVTLSVKMNRD